MDRKLRFAIYASRFPILMSYVMQGPPSYRTRRFSSLAYGACETVLTVKKLGGFLQSGGTIDPGMFIDEPLQAQKTLSHIEVSLNIAEAVTPFLYREIDGLSDEDARDVICSLFEVYLLTLGATKGQVVSTEPGASSKAPNSKPQPTGRMRTAPTANTTGDVVAAVNEQSASSFTQNDDTGKTTVADSGRGHSDQRVTAMVTPAETESDNPTRKQRPGFRVKKPTPSSEKNIKSTGKEDGNKTGQDDDALALLKMGSVDI